MDRYFLIDVSSNIVKNIIVWDGMAEYSPPWDTYMVPAIDDADIGWIYDPVSGIYTNPIPDPVIIDTQATEASITSTEATQ